MRKDIADLFASEGQAALKTLNDLRSRATDALELAIDGIPDVPSKRKKLSYVRESVFPLLLRLPKESDRLAALDDVAAATKLKPAVLKHALHRKRRTALRPSSSSNHRRRTGAKSPSAPCPRRSTRRSWSRAYSNATRRMPPWRTVSWATRSP